MGDDDTRGGHGVLETPLPGVSRAEEIADRLITAIAIGEYLPGTRLPSERDLAASLGVGRMTVRAALAALVNQGLLQTQRGRGGGSFVREQWIDSSTDSVQRTLSVRWNELRDACEAMARLHGAVAHAAADLRTGTDVVRLRERLESYRQAESGRDSQKADELLHLAILEAAHNETMKHILLDLERRVSLSAPAHLWGTAEGMRAMELRALTEHQSLVEAIVDQRSAQAGAIGLAHARIDMELLEAALSRASTSAP